MSQNKTTTGPSSSIKVTYLDSHPFYNWQRQHHCRHCSYNVVHRCSELVSHICEFDVADQCHMFDCKCSIDSTGPKNHLLTNNITLVWFFIYAWLSFRILRNKKISLTLRSYAEIHDVRSSLRFRELYTVVYTASVLEPAVVARFDKLRYL